MRQRAVALLVTTLLAVGGLAGCRETPAPFAVKETLARQMPGTRFDLEFHVRLGRITLSMTRQILQWVGEDAAEAAAILRHLRHVEVATYLVEDLPGDRELRRIELAAGLRLEERGWTTVVRVADPDERVWVFQRSRPDGQLSHLFVVALEEDELTLVSVEGRVDQLLAEEIAGEPGPFARLLAL